jgi:hypothetical protein
MNSNMTSINEHSWLLPGAGVTKSYDRDSHSFRICVVFFSGLAVYSAVELIIMILLSFRRYRGLYFWSVMLASLGITPYALGFLIKDLSLFPLDGTYSNTRWLGIVLLTLGWWLMVTGQSVVLWSRLHLVVGRGTRGHRILRATKWMIVVNAIILHIPTTVLTFGANGTDATATFARAYNIMEKVQMAGFFIQETLLSSIYIFETIRLLKTSLQQGTKKTMKQLIAINVIVIIMDLILLGLEGASLYILQTLLKGVIYSVKLKLEFAVLGKLVKHVRGAQPGPDLLKTSVGFSSSSYGSGCSEFKSNHDLDPEEFVDLQRLGSTISHPSRALRPVPRTDSVTDSAWSLALFEHGDRTQSLPVSRGARLYQRPLHERVNVA